MSDCGVREKVKKIYVLSTSPVKQAAVERWLALCRRRRRRLAEVTYLDAQPTGCPQPLGVHSATQCLVLRLPLRFTAEIGAMYIGIENFIALDAVGWADHVIVSATYVTREGALLMVDSIGQFANVIPRRFAPSGEPDVVAPAGYKQTVGQRIHDSYPHVPHDNWATAVSAANVDRATQIVDALRSLDEKLNAFVRH
jgi:hypothetical protein